VGFIKAEVKVSGTRVPQNVEFKYTVEISWNGDVDRYEIEALETPALINLEVVGNASSNRVSERAGEQLTVKVYEFMLRPIEMGMAYIDGMVITYKDVATGETHELKTRRLEVEVIDPVFDDRQNMLMLVVGAALSLIIVAGAAVVMLQRRKRRRASQNKVRVEFTLIEDKYLTALKDTGNAANSDAVGLFSGLSKLLRNYLRDRYDIDTTGKSSAEIIAALNDQAVTQQVLAQVEEILNTCDTVKFSGGKVDAGTQERIYTLVEDILTRNKADFIEDTNMISENKH